ncbi:MAG TPA: hypothetical protein VF789_10670 [Thermoanaerobaculia bacterium]
MRVARVLLHVAFAAAVIAWGGLRLRAMNAERALPPLRPTPLEVRPLYDDPGVADAGQVRRVLRRLGLPFRRRETSIGHVEHALRLWGANATFPDPRIMPGKRMRSLLTSHLQFQWTYVGDQPPLLIDVGPGVRVRALEGPASSPHADHTLGSLAEIGTPLDFPIITPERETTFRAVVEQSLRDFSLNQAEPEWSALTYALFLPPTRRWITSEGQEMTFDRLAGRLMREAPSEGVCSGNHRLHALVVFLRVDDRMAAEGRERILSPAGRQRIVDYLRAVTDAFVRHQHPDGFWNGKWPDAAPAGSAPVDADGDRLSDRLIVTGHVLEWWSLAPEELQPPREVKVAAGQWLVRTVDGLSDAEIAANYTFLTHVGRALAQWHGVFPSEIDLRGEGPLAAGRRVGG